VKLAFVRDEYLPMIQSLNYEMKIVKASDFQTVIAEHSDEFFQSGVTDTRKQISTTDPRSTLADLETEALIVYTSGTTGNPKGVVLTQYNLLCDAKYIAEWHGLKKGDAMMCVLPIHHVNGTVVTLVTPMFYGGRVVLNQKFQTETFFERLANEKVKIVSVVPTLLAFLVQGDIDTSQYDLSHFSHFICGAGPLTVELAAKFEDRYNLKIIHGYGLSETTCYSCYLPIDLSEEEHKRMMRQYGFPSIGVPLPCNEMAIWNERGEKVRAGWRGEIVIRGHNVMKGYYNNQEANLTYFKGERVASFARSRRRRRRRNRRPMRENIRSKTGNLNCNMKSPKFENCIGKPNLRGKVKSRNAALVSKASFEFAECEVKVAAEIAPLSHIPKSL